LGTEAAAQMRTTETARLRPRNISDSPSALRWRSLAFDTSLRDYSGRTDGNYLNKKQKKEKPKTQSGNGNEQKVDAAGEPTQSRRRVGDAARPKASPWGVLSP